MTGPQEPERDRKAEHLALALEQRMRGRSAFEEIELEHEALPELDLDRVDCEREFLGRRLRAPILISCMTGGTEQAQRINRVLAEAAQQARVAFGLGSVRKALEEPALLPTYQVRDLAPDVPILSNLGAVQLNQGRGVDDCRRAVEMVEADALVLHLNPLQEALQPEGQTNFAGLLPKIEAVVAALEVPVLVKEVGSGISAATGRRLREAGVEWVDTAGVGGTSWARIEGARAGADERGTRFFDWGLSTVDSLLALGSVGGLRRIGSGGVRDGLDVAKALVLGAELAGLAQPALEAAADGVEAVLERLEEWRADLRVAMFCTGAATLSQLPEVRWSRRPPPLV